MKTKKMSLDNLKNVIKDVLSREEMKQVMAGSGEGCGTCVIHGTGSDWIFGCTFQAGFACVCSGNNDIC